MRYKMSRYKLFETKAEYYFTVSSTIVAIATALLATVSIIIEVI